MAWFLVYDSLGHGDEHWKVALHTITKKVALTARSREDAVKEAGDHWADLCRGNPFPRLSRPRLRHEESLLMTMGHLSLEDSSAAIFRYGDEDPAYTVAWTDDAQKARVTGHLAVCEICRDSVARERERNDVYRVVCVERKATLDEVAALQAELMKEPPHV